jgi:hypothetical protein
LFIMEIIMLVFLVLNHSILSYYKRILVKYDHDRKHLYIISHLDEDNNNSNDNY